MTIEPKAIGLDSADELAIRAVVAEFASTWNRHDMLGMHDLDTEDVEWINVTGNHWRGKAAVFKGHAALHRTIFAKTEMSVESAVLRAIAQDAAVAVATMTFAPVVMPSGHEIPELTTRGSFILVKHGGTWKIAHFHNTSVDAEAARNDPTTWDTTGYLPGPTKTSVGS